MSEHMDFGHKKDSLLEQMAFAKSAGYKEEFMSKDAHSITNYDKSRDYAPDEVTIIHHYRFEGESNPDDMSILYLLETADGTKGILSDAYGTYSNPDIDCFIKAVEKRAEV